MLAAQTSQTPQRSPQPDLPVAPLLGTGAVLGATLLALLHKYVVIPLALRVQRGVRFSQSQDAEIRDCLTRIRTLTTSDRVMLCQFVPQGKTVAGQQTYSLAVTHEVASPGVAKAAPVATTGNTTCVEFVIQSLSANEFQKRDIANVTDKSYRQYLFSLGVYYVTCYLLKIDGAVAGFVAIHYLNRTSLIDWEAITESDLEPDSQRISFILKNSSDLWHNLWRSFTSGV